jgi:hypothetical protein
VKGSEPVDLAYSGQVRGKRPDLRSILAGITLRGDDIEDMGKRKGHSLRSALSKLTGINGPYVLDPFGQSGHIAPQTAHLGDV